MLDARDRVLLPLRLLPLRLLPLRDDRLLPLLRLLVEPLLLRLLVEPLLLRLVFARPLELAEREFDDFFAREDDDFVLAELPPERPLVPALSGDITLLPGSGVPARTGRVTRGGVSYTQPFTLQSLRKRRGAQRAIHQP